MTIHIPAYPHLDTIKENSWCAYTQKIRRLADMLVEQGHGVVLYGGPDSDSKAKHITIVTEEDRKGWFGDTDWKETVFSQFSPEDPWWKTMNERFVEEAFSQMSSGDFIAITAGWPQMPITTAFQSVGESHVLCFESGIGYEGVFANYRVYESYAWMHWLFGKNGIADGRNYDAVIPNAYDPDEFSLQEFKEDFVLFVGRHIPRKGLSTVAEVAKHVRVISAGQNGPIEGVEYVGVLNPEERNKLMGMARCLIAPTGYIEPFGGVAVEAQFCGTPVITTDFGAFPETVIDGVTGFRCHTLGEFLNGVKKAEELDPKLIRGAAVSRYSTDSVGPMYSDYLRRLDTLRGAGWYTIDAE